MKDTEKDHLVREVVGGPHLEALRQASLTRGLHLLRRRRRRAVILRAGAVTALIAMVATLAVNFRKPEALPLSEDKLPLVVTISDDQLLSLFAERGVALVGVPGDQQLMFLDLGVEGGGELP